MFFQNNVNCFIIGLVQWNIREEVLNIKRYYINKLECLTPCISLTNENLSIPKYSQLHLFYKQLITVVNLTVKQSETFFLKKTYLWLLTNRTPIVIQTSQFFFDIKIFLKSHNMQAKKSFFEGNDQFNEGNHLILKRIRFQEFVVNHFLRDYISQIVIAKYINTIFHLLLNH